MCSIYTITFIFDIYITLIVTVFTMVLDGVHGARVRRDAARSPVVARRLALGLALALGWRSRDATRTISIKR